MSLWALVAVKARAQCKTRLASQLDAETRLALVRGMLAHVIATACACPLVDQVALVSPERDEAPPGCPIILDEGLDLNAALATAVVEAQRRGAERVLILPADLPRLAVADVAALVEAAPHGVALAPDAAGTGTNALSLARPAEFTFSFGQGSFARHLAAAGQDAAVVVRRGLCDLDLPEHLPLLAGCAWAQASGVDQLAREVSGASR